MNYILAIDSGGTKCDALLVGEDGAAIARGNYTYRASKMAYGNMGGGRTPSAIRDAMRGAMGDRPYDTLHLVTHRRWAPQIVKMLAPAKTQKVKTISVGEYSPALTLVGADHGIVALAGTGAGVYGRNRRGKCLMLDAIGPVIGDYGSAVYIGYMALKAAAKSGWNPRHATSLRHRIYKACGAYEKEPFGYSLVEFSLMPHDRTVIAALAKLVDEEANAGDRVARSILENAAEALAETVYDAVAWLDMFDDDYVMAGTGSVAMKSDIFWERLSACVAKFAPRLKPVRCELPPVVGTAIVGLKRVNARDFEAAKGRLLATASPLFA